MKKSLLLIGALAVAVSAMADKKEDCMVVDMAGAGAEDVSISLSSVQKITFGEGSINILDTKDATATYALADIDRIYFNLTGAGVESVIDDSASGSLTHAAGSDIITLTGVEAQAVRIYDASGAMVLATANTGDIDVAQLTTGKLYIAVAGDFTAKFIK